MAAAAVSCDRGSLRALLKEQRADPLLQQESLP